MSNKPGGRENTTGRQAARAGRPKKKGSRKRPPRRRGEAKVPCALCGKLFRRLTAAHLRTHGYTPATYARVFGGDVSPPATPRVRDGSASPIGTPRATLAGATSPSELRRQLAAELSPQVAERLLTEQWFVGMLATDVAATLMGGPIRERLRMALVGMLVTRMELHGQAAARLRAVSGELAEPWRVEQGGEGGAPTSTKELVALAGQALAEIKTGEELVLKAVKLAIDEAKVPPPASAAGNPLDRYTGSAERVAIPEGVSASDRETIRNLLGMIAEGAAAKGRVLDAEAAVPVEATVVERGTPDEAPPAGDGDSHPEALAEPEAPTPPPEATALDPLGLPRVSVPDPDEPF